MVRDVHFSHTTALWPLCGFFCPAPDDRKERGSKNVEHTFMKERAILPLVLTMSLPMVLSMLVSSLYNIVDS